MESGPRKSGTGAALITRNDVKTTVGVGIYVLGVAAAYVYGLAWLLVGTHPAAMSSEFLLGLKCAATGGLGGCFYCLRGIYLNVSVHRRWGNEWLAWYIIRPLVSGASGGISYLFMKAGLLILESGKKADSSDIGFFCIAFIAGLNVDRFVEKVEDVAASLWGIKKSRAGQQPKDIERE